MKHSSTERLAVISAKVSANDRALVSAVATLTGVTVSAAVRDLVTRGARKKLQELTAATLGHLPKPGSRMVTEPKSTSLQ